MLELVKIINHDFSGVLSLLSSLIMVIVTIIYVRHAKRQADYAKESVDLITQQIKTDKQPCIVPSVTDSDGYAFDATDYTRIQLGFDINLKNVGDAPAINIYTLADIELQMALEESGNKKVLSAALLPYFVQALSSGGETTINIHFETDEVNSLVQELSETMEMNWERIKTNPSHHPYRGALLIIRALFKNTMGQWCESVISYEIPWLKYRNPPKRKTKNLNENTIPPKQIREGDEFKAVLLSNHLAPFSYKMTTDKHVKTLLNQYIDDSPWLAESVKLEFSSLD